MATAMQSKEVTTKQVTAVRFGFYTEEEVSSFVQSVRLGYTQAPPRHPPPLFRHSASPAVTAPVPAARIQARKLSVVRITTPIIFDNMKVPVADGLYDPKMGPLDTRGR